MSGRDVGGQLDDAFRSALFGALADSAESWVSCIDRQRRVLFLNRTLTRDLSDILGKPIDDFIVSPQKEAAVECVEHAFSSREPRQLEYTVVLAAGAPRRLLTRVVPFQGPRGEELALLLTSDVSEQRRLAQELEQSTQFRRRVIENLPDFVMVIDRERRNVWVNRVAPQLTEADVIGAKVDSFIVPDGLARVHGAIDAAFQGEIGYYECEGYGDGQSNAWYAVRVVPVASDAGIDNVLLITTDITERKRAERALRETEEQLHRAQRLESLGQLAGGIAHDFNNLLQVIASNLSFAKQGLEYEEPIREELELAMRATERAAELTSHLLAIGRRKHVEPKRVELGDLVEHALRMLRRAIPENVTLDYVRPQQRCCVDLDAPQFEQVLINLCVNSRDAMPRGGTLSIRIEPEGAAHVVMSVRDTGVGIPPENLRRIFEPFFTTKGAGSGLGLAVASGIVAAHGGLMTAESDGRSGTTIKVRLPRATLSSEQPATPADLAVSGSGVILIAEDEDLVRAQLERILRRAGYTVLQAKDGVHAVELFRQHESKIDLVVMDAVMPRLDGWQAFLKMEQLKPTLRVLFTTGYAASVLPDDFAARGAHLLTKPYNPERLLTEVRDLMARTGQPRA